MVVLLGAQVGMLAPQPFDMAPHLLDQVAVNYLWE